MSLVQKDIVETGQNTECLYGVSHKHTRPVYNKGDTATKRVEKVPYARFSHIVSKAKSQYAYNSFYQPKHRDYSYAHSVLIPRIVFGNAYINLYNKQYTQFQSFIMYYPMEMLQFLLEYVTAAWATLSIRVRQWRSFASDP